MKEVAMKGILTKGITIIDLQAIKKEPKLLYKIL